MKPSGALSLALDAVWLLLLVLVAGPPSCAVTALYGAAGHILPGWANALLLPLYGVLFLALLIGMGWLVRLLLPRVRPGSFQVPSSTVAKAWGLHFALQRVLYLPLWRVPIFCIAGLRTMLLRALGAKVPLAIQTASDPQILDAAMITIEEGAMIASGCLLSGHMVLPDGRLRLAPIRIGRGATLTEAVHVGPGVTIEDGASVGPLSTVGPDCRLGEGASLGMECRLVSNVEVGAGARLGHFVTCERGVRIAAGAVVPSGTHLRRGAVVEADEEEPPERAPPDGA